MTQHPRRGSPACRPLEGFLQIPRSGQAVLQGFQECLQAAFLGESQPSSKCPSKVRHHSHHKPGWPHAPDEPSPPA